MGELKSISVISVVLFIGAGALVGLYIIPSLFLQSRLYTKYNKICIFLQRSKELFLILGKIMVVLFFLLNFFNSPGQRPSELMPSLGVC